MKKTYLTTPIYYVNDVPHIGHAYTTIAADILARWHRLIGHAVFFLTGTDEHGAKIDDAAKKSSESPQALVDRTSAEFKRLWTVLNISNDDFIRTSESRHQMVVQSIFEKMKESGDIYKGVYEDWYCLSDEAYYSENELIDKKCPSCGRDVQKLKEESYFFKLSKYENLLLDFYSQHPDFLSPKLRAGEIINFVKSGLRDLSVSRTRVKWGIPVLSDPSHVVYVWFDALINYISAPGFNSQSQPLMVPPFSEVWPADIHFVGKEIFRFHAIIWPAMLMSLGMPLPKKVFAHGWWTVDGTKMSKSLGNVVNPHKMVATYGVDASRYFLFREVPFGADGDFSEKSLLLRFNAELANNLGNLYQRSVTLLSKNFQCVLPSLNKMSGLLGNTPSWAQQMEMEFEECSFGDVLENLFKLMVKTNKYIEDKAPWKLGAEQKTELATILFECFCVLKVLAVYLYPFMPTKMNELWSALGEKEPISSAGSLVISLLKEGKPIPFKENQTAIKGPPLFMRL